MLSRRSVAYEITVIAVALGFGGIAFAQSKRVEAKAPVDPVQSFEKVVRKYENFFASPQLAIFAHSKEGAESSQTGKYYDIQKFNGEVKSFDVTKTDSIISPYAAILNAQVIRQARDWMGSDCGDYRKGGTVLGWSSVDLALENKDTAACFSKTFGMAYRFHFAFQHDKWILKNVTQTNAMQENGLVRLFDLPVMDLPEIYYTDKTPMNTDPKIVEFNEKWKALL